MSEERPDDKFPTWELCATEVAYPQLVQGRTVYVHMRPYKAADLKALQRERGVRMAQADEWADMKDVGKTEVIQFFWSHFIRLSGPGVRRKDGSEGTPEEHREWVTGHPRFDIERTAVIGGYAGLKLAPAEEIASSLLDMVDTNEVVAFQNVFSHAIGKECILRMTHRFRAETEADNRRYQQAIGNVRVFTRKRESQVLVNYDTLEQIYDGLILAVDGMTCNGKPCAQENKDEWVRLVPFWHKDIVLTELFRGASAKND